MKKPISEAIRKDLGREEFVTWFIEIALIEHECEHAIKNINNWAKALPVDTAMLVGPAMSRITYEPLGVICIMGSWNFPLYSTLGPLINVIAAGNTAVIKPSELAPYTVIALRNLI